MSAEKEKVSRSDTALDIGMEQLVKLSYISVTESTYQQCGLPSTLMPLALLVYI